MSLLNITRIYCMFYAAVVVINLEMCSMYIVNNLMISFVFHLM